MNTDTLRRFTISLPSELMHEVEARAAEWAKDFDVRPGTYMSAYTRRLIRLGLEVEVKRRAEARVGLRSWIDA